MPRIFRVTGRMVASPIPRNPRHTTALQVAIVIPVLDEAPNLRRRLSGFVEIADLVVVSDGGSSDDSIAAATEIGATVVRGPSGRGPQLNQGAREAIRRGADALLFVHADTDLPDDAVERVRAALVGGAPGGGFLVAIDQPRGLLRLAAPLVNARTRVFQVPLGDQAQFVSVAEFEEMGGYPDWPILEDFDFVRRLRRRGRLAVIESPVTPSTRRFREQGVVRTVLRNWWLWALFLWGVEPVRLARWYRHVR